MNFKGFRQVVISGVTVVVGKEQYERNYTVESLDGRCLELTSTFLESNPETVIYASVFQIRGR